MDLSVKRRRILPPPRQSGSPGPGGGQYHPVKTDALSKLPATPDTYIRLKELIRDMPLSPSGCGVDNNLTVDGHNKVDARSCGCSLLAWRRNIMILANLSRVGLQRQEEGIYLWCFKIGCHLRHHHHCRGRVPKQASEGGIWRQYDRSEKYFGCKQRSE